MMTTLTIRNIVWEVGSYGGKASFTHVYSNTSITFHPSVREYAVWSGKNEYFSSPDVAECLEMATNVILDLYAGWFTPTWEDDAPDTERNPNMYEEVCNVAEQQHV